MARNYAALPHEYLDEFEELTDEELGRLVRALLHYSAEGVEPVLEGNERFLWRRVARQEDRYQESYEMTVTFNRERAKKAAAARWHKDTPAETSMLKDAQASVSIAQNAINKTETKTKTKTETETKTENKTLPSSEGESYMAPALSPAAMAMREKVQATMARLRAYRQYLEEDPSRASEPPEIFQRSFQP